MQEENKGLTKEVKDILEQIETIRNLLANSDSITEIKAYCSGLENLMVELEQAVKNNTINYIVA